MRKGVLYSIVIIFIFSNYSFALCVKVPDANLRSGPGTTYKKTWEVFKYMPFKKLVRSGSWYKVKDVDGDVHWIYRNLVTNKYDCAVVKSETANVRKGPDTRFKKKYFSPVLKYDTFKVLQRKGGWVKVLDEFGEEGWIFRKLLWIY